ncbi:MAG: IS21 family transposase [Acidobacteria bacterium]|nr:IS21 family transposase [Acidobacteriota bacterium]
MLDQELRLTILQLSERGQSRRRIAKLLGVSRGAVGEVIGSGSSEVPRLVRPERAEEHRDHILELIAVCKGNLVRVHEELQKAGADFSYQALTGFCRRHGLSSHEKTPAGSYDFAPGEEMQHDTSPHEARIGDCLRRVQTASLVLCYSRMLFFQFYPTFRRFDCKLFLTDALRYFGGSCRRCMIDNTHVVVLKGTGADMVPVPEMEAFAHRFSFEFRAHEKGDANRSARVERPFGYIENNFLAGRSFADWTDANRHAREWCDRVNGSFKRHLRARPRELFAVEQARLIPLPAWIPDPYEIHSRIVDVDGFISSQTNRYSVPARLIGRRVEVRVSKDRVTVYEGPREVASHQREIDPKRAQVVEASHRPPRGQSKDHRHAIAEEEEILRRAPELSDYLAAMRRGGSLQQTLSLRQLLRMVREYPRAPLLEAIAAASRSGLYDMDRLETVILRNIRRDYFLLGDDPVSEDIPR